MAGRYRLVDPSQHPTQPVFVEYIENTSQSWISCTDIKDSSDMSVECKVGITGVITQYGTAASKLSWLVGCYAGIGFGITDGYRVIIPNKTSDIQVELGKTYDVKIFRNSSRQRCTLIEGQTITTSANSASSPLTIFAQSQYIGSYHSYHPGKIYSIKVYRGDVLSNDLRPCISRESGHYDEPALYDIINKKYYYNSGVGTFQTGQPVITPSYKYKIVDPTLPVFVEYIQSTGTQRMEPDLLATDVGNLEEVSMDFSFIQNTGSQPTILNFYGIQVYTGSTTGNFSLWFRGDDKTYGSVNYDGTDLNRRYNVYVRRPIGGTIQYSFNGGPLKNVGPTPSSAYGVILFGYTIGNYSSYIKLYGCKFTRDGVVIRDLRPCLSREVGHIDEPALYDMVNKKYYYNKGTGTFLTGPRMRASRKLILFPPDLREWIQLPPGTRFIMDDVISHTALRNTSFKTKFRQYGNSSEYCQIIGMIKDSHSCVLRIVSNRVDANTLLWYQYNDASIAAGSSSKASDNDCIIELGPNISKQDGANVWINNNTIQSHPGVDGDCMFYVGSSDEKNRTYKFYYIEIYKWDKLVCDLRPCLSTEPGHIDEPALYDMVTNKYYYSNTGDASVGNKI